METTPPRRPRIVAASLPPRYRPYSGSRGQADVLRLARGLARLVVVEWDIVNDTLTWQSPPDWLLGPRPPGGYPLFPDLVHPEDKAHFLRRRMEEEEITYRILRTDGQVVWAAARAKVYRSPDGEPERLVAVIQDISDRKRVETELLAQRERMRMVHEVAGLHSVDWDVEADTLSWNDDPRTLLGDPPASGTYPTFAEMVHPDDRALYLARRAAALVGEGPATQEFRIVRTDGATRWLSVRQRPGSGAGTKGRALLAVQDISEREQLTYLAQHDSLTGLPNRHLFRDRLRQATARAKREQRRVAVMFLDLDRFKQVNDNLGHGAGDVLLRLVGERWAACLRKTDTVARVGGDEFAVIVEGFQTRDQVTWVAEKLLTSLDAPFDLDGTSASVGVSIGIALLPEDGEADEVLLQKADTAMYQAKRNRGGSRYAGDLLEAK